MALSKETLKTMIKGNIENLFKTPANAEMLEKLSKAIADAVVDHINSAAEVRGSTATPNGKAGSDNLAGTFQGKVY